MAPRRTPSVWMALGMCSGISTAFLLHPDPGTYAMVLVTSLFLLAVSLYRLPASLCRLTASLFPIPAGIHRKRPLWPRMFMGAAFLAFFAFGGWSASQRLPTNQPRHYIHFPADTNTSWQVRLSQRLRPTPYSLRWVGVVERRQGEPAQGKILVQLPPDTPQKGWKPADVLIIRGQAEPFPEPLNPHQFDYGRYMRSLGIAGRIRPVHNGVFHFPSGARGIAEHAGRLRHRVLGLLENTRFGAETNGMLQALILGERSGLDPGLYRAYQEAGAVHLLAVSGLHVGIFAGLAGWLFWPLRRLKRGKWLHFLAGLLLLWCYAALAGFGPSVVRASVMCSFLSYAVLLNRRGDSLHFLALAALIMLGLLDPLWLFQAGFQMSFAAVWAILSLYPFCIRKWPFKRGIGKKIGQLLCVSGCAQLGVLPVSLYYFHQFPLLFWVSNLLLVPLMGMVIASGFLLLLLALTASVPPWLPGPAEAFFATFNQLVHILGGQGKFLLTGIPWDGIQLAASLLALAAFGKYTETLRIRWLGYAGILLVAVQVQDLLSTLQSAQTQEWLVPHRYGQSALLIRQGRELSLCTTTAGEFEGLVRDFSTGERIGKVSIAPLYPAYVLGGRRFLHIDGSGNYNPGGGAPAYLLLTGSPKIHLGRVLDELRPGVVIADGSNYSSFIRRWETSCRERGIPFHDTAVQGAYRSPMARLASVRSPSGASSGVP
ncbi:ComEC/Rec2 family competence protein [Robiginitalea sp. SC105]|uniref:ComEC/Rec2 family competence protein n=1 Tax=Robiginitalea sp. SC105 TaxID=2762332 RepID=UPI00163A0EC6|nr:ComEC/Rec2 family competence protein [Robiginitalea sp. SC105]MBC2837797.1 ComEC family competence protein [Robiginitalea sp. SC105]